jgi:hypothetical protein
VHHRRALIVAAFAVGALAVGLLSSRVGIGRTALPATTCPPDELLVKFQPAADPSSVAARYGATILSRIQSIDIYVLAVQAGNGPVTIAALQSDPEVVFAEPNALVGIPEQPPPAPEPCGPTTGA